MEAVSRARFVAERYAALAHRNVSLPTMCGQTVPEPLLVARMLAGSRLDPSLRVLSIGLGSGYATAVLAQLVAQVVAAERITTLVQAAAARLSGLAIGNVEIHWADGLRFGSDTPFDRILIFGRVDPLPARMWSLVKEGGAIVHARTAPPGPEAQHRQVLVRVERQGDGIGRQTILCPSRLAPLRQGLVGAAPTAAGPGRRVAGDGR